jgi:hypothetical protein
MGLFHRSHTAALRALPASGLIWRLFAQMGSLSATSNIADKDFVQTN